jgi:uncharacterized delta-60 repeat protein
MFASEPKSDRRAVLCLLLSPLAFLASEVSAAPGDFDPTFGAGGIVTTDFFGNNDNATAVAVQPDGKIVVAGWVQSGADMTTADFAVARYNPDGTLDSDFGTGGMVTSDFAGSTDLAHAVAIQADGRIIVAGEAISGTQNSFALIRYNNDGAIDTSFGNGGKVLTTFSDRDSRAYEIVLQPDQKIAVAGDSFHTPAPSLDDSDFALARYNSDGSLDVSFGTGGLVTTDFLSFGDGARSLVRQRDGKLIAAGSAHTTMNGSGDFALARYNLDGTLDTTFGPNGDGRVTTDFLSDSDGGLAMVLQADGAIIVAGFTFFGTPDNNHGFALARYGADGNLDPDFGADGKVITDLGPGGDLAASVVVQPDGKVLAGGYANFELGSDDLDLALVRYNSDGSLDSEFGSDGTVITNLTPGIDTLAAMAMQADGKLIATGGAGSDFLVARYLTGVSGTTPQPLNLSTRASVGTGENVLIGGFIITGADSKRVILRALGPSMLLGDATPVLADPVLELHAPDGTVTTNDNWRDTQEQEIIGATLNPADDRESAIVGTLAPGPYTVVVRGDDNSSGVGLVELYDLDEAADSKLANLSSRGFVGSSDNVMIAGLILADENNATLVLRGLGPSLGQFGIADSLQDTTLELYDANGTVTAFNDDWRNPQEAALQASSLAPTDDREAALLVELTAGAYTAILRGKNDSSGVGLIEVYNLQ